MAPKGKAKAGADAKAKPKAKGKTKAKAGAEGEPAAAKAKAKSKSAPDTEGAESEPAQPENEAAPPEAEQEPSQEEWQNQEPPHAGNPQGMSQPPNAAYLQGMGQPPNAAYAQGMGQPPNAAYAQGMGQPLLPQGATQSIKSRQPVRPGKRGRCISCTIFFVVLFMIVGLSTPFGWHTSDAGSDGGETQMYFVGLWRIEVDPQKTDSEGNDIVDEKAQKNMCNKNSTALQLECGPHLMWDVPAHACDSPDDSSGLCTRWKQVYLSSIVALICGCASVLFFIIGAIVQCKCPFGARCVKLVFFSLAPVTAIGGLAYYYVATQELPAKCTSSYSCGLNGFGVVFWGFALLSVYGLVPMIIVAFCPSSAPPEEEAQEHGLEMGQRDLAMQQAQQQAMYLQQQQAEFYAQLQQQQQQEENNNAPETPEKPAPSKLGGESKAALRLRAELEDMKKSALRKKAKQSGVSEYDLEMADDADDPKEAFIALILRQVEETKKGALRERAKQLGMSADELEGAVNADEPREALIALIMKSVEEEAAKAPPVPTPAPVPPVQTPVQPPVQPPAQPPAEEPQQRASPVPEINVAPAPAPAVKPEEPKPAKPQYALPPPPGGNFGGFRASNAPPKNFLDDDKPPAYLGAPLAPISAFKSFDNLPSPAEALRSGFGSRQPPSMMGGFGSQQPPSMMGGFGQSALPPPAPPAQLNFGSQQPGFGGQQPPQMGFGGPGPNQSTPSGFQQGGYGQTAQPSGDFGLSAPADQPMSQSNSQPARPPQSWGFMPSNAPGLAPTPQMPRTMPSPRDGYNQQQPWCGQQGNARY